jgi:putative ABC transport system permease protein
MQNGYLTPGPLHERWRGSRFTLSRCSPGKMRTGSCPACYLSKKWRAHLKITVSPFIPLFLCFRSDAMLIYLKLFKESLLFALHALVVNKLRTFLSLLGITIGIFTMISVFTVVDALKSNIRESIQSLGENVIYIQKWPWTFGKDYPWWKYWQRPLPGYTEMEDLKTRITTAEAMALMAFINVKTIKYRNNNIENADVTAVSHDWYRIKSFELQEGRYFTEQESLGGRAVAIVGSEVANNLFPDGEPLDKEFMAIGRKFKVIGVLEREGKSILDNSNDNSIIIPINFARKILDIRSDRLNPFIMVKGKPGITNAELKDELRGAMRSIRRLRPTEEDDFALNESDLLSKNLIEPVLEVISWAGVFIGGFSILVGGFGIANIMFVSVKERTNIIGIQKSLGAKNYFILLQFLAEAIFLCLIGGGMGLLIVFLLSFTVSQLLDMNLLLTQGNILFGLGISAVIGIISGFVPAYTASQLDPVEAIRAN